MRVGIEELKGEPHNRYSNGIKKWVALEKKQVTESSRARNPSHFPDRAKLRMLDINLFRVDKGGNPEVVRESQRKRGASVEVVDEIIALDREWVKRNVFLSPDIF